MSSAIELFQWRINGATHFAPMMMTPYQRRMGAPFGFSQWRVNGAMAHISTAGRK